ncbi:MAG: ADP-ribosylglycohydrolase family protein [Christensenellales bacterium]|jgi:hypothetical protein
MNRNDAPVCWESLPHTLVYSSHLNTELAQWADEGRDVESLRALTEAISGLPLGDFREELADALYRAFSRAAQRPGYPYDEPSEIIAIRERRPADRPAFSKPTDPETLRDRIAGAWLGRICGCLLGKPVEGYTRSQIRTILRKTSNEPLSRYMREDPELPELLGVAPEAYKKRCWIGNIQGCAPVDDDTNYTVMAARCIVGVYGRGFTPEDVARAWIDSQTRRWYCTAEMVAYANIENGIAPPSSACWKNPFREWIGAQIRGDYFGYINPGDPETAADMAWRDASISHIKNGIYGEMFVAAMLAAAAVCDDIPRVIEAGLAQIPERSRLTECVREVIGWHGQGVPAAECIERIHRRFDERLPHHWCHTLSNAMIVAAALLYGGGDYGRSISMAVEASFDTDCNGATVGSVIGMMVGEKGIPPQWTEPIGGMLDTTIAGIGRISVQELVSLTMCQLP